MQNRIRRDDAPVKVPPKVVPFDRSGNNERPHRNLLKANGETKL